MKWICFIFILVVLTTAHGCNRLSLRQPLSRSAEDIPMFGYTPMRNNFSFSAVKPPLDSIWNIDLGAGTSFYPPAVVDNLLFIGNLRGDILVAHTDDGKIYGKKKMGMAIVGTPVIDGDVIYIVLTNSKRDVVAYNFRKARELWELKIGSVESSPLLLESKLYIGTLNGEFFCINTVTGNIEWKFNASADSKKLLIRSSPSTDGNYIVFCYDNGTVVCIQKDGTLSWKYKTAGGTTASPAIAGENVYISSADSNVYALSVRTGLLVWKSKLSAAVYSSPAVNEKYVIAGSVDGTVWCLNRRNGDKLWIRKTNGVIASSPVISGALLYVGNLAGELNAISIENGDVVDERLCNGRLKTSPLIYKQFIFLVVESRMLIGFQGSNQ